MGIIPLNLQSAIQAHLGVLLSWFSDEVYRRLLPHAQTHFLAQLHQHLDFAPLVDACAPYHHGSGPGAPASHPVPRLVRALLVKYLLDLSLRELEQTIRWNLLVKWFVGYAVFESGPDHATLERFEQWVHKHHTRTFFDQILIQIDRDYPEERCKAQSGDTFAMRAFAANETLIRLIRHTCQCLLAALADGDPTLFAHVESQLDRTGLFGASDEIKEFRLDQTQRGQRLHTTVVAALTCQTLIRAQLSALPPTHSPRLQPVLAWLDTLDKIFTDELAITRDDAGQVTAVSELPKNKKGDYRIASATDPAATFRVHGEHIDFGYNVSLATTKSFVCEIRADTGSQPDSVAIPDLIAAQLAHRDVVPPKLIYDMAAGTGKSHAQVDRVSHGRTQLVAPLMPYDQRAGRLGPDDFALSPDGLSLTCPHGKVSSTAYRSHSGEGRSFRFTPDQCARCPLAPDCRGDRLPSHHMRQVFISDHRSILAAARTYALTPDFRQDLSQRATIERIIANLVRYHGARHARRRGRSWCDYQVKMNATAFNIRQWLRLLQRPTAAPAQPPCS